MEELILFVLQTLFDVVWSVLFELPFEWLPRRSERADVDGTRFGWMLWVLIGTLVGGVSVWLWPHSFATRPAQRVATLIGAPLLSAAVGYAIAVWRSASNPTIMPASRAWQAFWFTLGFVGVRYIEFLGQ